MTVGHHENGHRTGALILWTRSQTRADLADEPPDRVVQRSATPRLEYERSDVLDGRVVVDQLVSVVGLRQRDHGPAVGLTFLGDERIESALGVVGDGMHRTGPVEQSSNKRVSGLS